MIHVLKTLPEYFNAIISGVKTFEIRKNDRNYRVGDELKLCEYISNSDSLTGRYVLVKVTYILDSSDYLRDGFVAMAISRIVCGFE